MLISLNGPLLSHTRCLRNHCILQTVLYSQFVQKHTFWIGHLCSTFLRDCVCVERHSLCRKWGLLNDATRIGADIAPLGFRSMPRPLVSLRPVKPSTMLGPSCLLRALHHLLTSPVCVLNSVIFGGATVLGIMTWWFTPAEAWLVSNQQGTSRALCQSSSFSWYRVAPIAQAADRED